MYLTLGFWFWFLLVGLVLTVVWFWARLSDTSKKANSPKLVTDPVCKMEFPVDKAVTKVRHAGKTYYFCAKACRRDFERDPSSYIGAAQGTAV